MNKFVSVLVLGSALALSACGGDSDSSGSDINGSTPSNGQSPTKPNLTTKKSCSVSGSTVNGLANDSCRFEDKDANANMVISCNGNTMTLDGNIGKFNSSNSTYSRGTNIGGFVLLCPQ